jgi:hypothetical protein
MEKMPFILSIERPGSQRDNYGRRPNWAIPLEWLGGHN